jgi:hypothetical protein
MSAYHMGDFVQFQEKIHCEPCKECGARPVIEQSKGAFIVRCPNSKAHYQTKPGLIDLQDWNLKNKVRSSLGNTEDKPNKEAS